MSGGLSKLLKRFGLGKSKPQIPFATEPISKAIKVAKLIPAVNYKLARPSGSTGVNDVQEEPQKRLIGITRCWQKYYLNDSVGVTVLEFPIMDNANQQRIHDSVVLGYEVNCETREVKIRTEYRDGGGARVAHPKRTDVLFEGVISYQFIDDSFGTILLDIQEVDTSDLVKNNWSDIERGHRFGSWPGQWGASVDGTLAYIESESIRGYSINSSIGMSGWLFAKAVRFIPIS